MINLSWECCKCGYVWAYHVKGCDNCNASKNIKKINDIFAEMQNVSPCESYREFIFRIGCNKEIVDKACEGLR